MQIPTLGIIQNDINNIIDDHNDKNENYSDTLVKGEKNIYKQNNKQKKFNYFKTLICLTIIFFVLTVLAFTSKFALALKIIFACIATALINCVKSCMSL